LSFPFSFYLYNESPKAISAGGNLLRKGAEKHPSTAEKAPADRSWLFKSLKLSMKKLEGLDIKK